MALGLIGGVLGIGIAYEGLRLLVAIGPANLPRLSEISLDGRSLWFTLALSLLSGLLFGSIPVLRYAGPRTPAALRGAGRTASVSRERQRSRDLLVVAQVAMALVLLVSAMLMIRTFQALRHGRARVHACGTSADRAHLDSGFPGSGPATGHPHAKQHCRQVGGDSGRDLGGRSQTQCRWKESNPTGTGFKLRGRHSAEDTPMRLFKYVSPGFFHTSGTRMIAGRELTWTEIYGRRPVVIISENLARESWGSASAALGKRLQ